MDLDNFIRFVGLDKILELSLNKSIVLSLLLTIFLLSVFIANGANTSNNPVVFSIEINRTITKLEF